MSDDEGKKQPSLHGNSDYSPEVTKMLKGWKDGPVWGPGFNKVLDLEKVPDLDDGRENITWRELRDRHGYEKPGKGLKLTGDISQRDKNNWQYQKHVKLRDREGTEHAVFFYVDEPYHWNYDDMEVGSVMTIYSPRLHRFMDGQDGMRLDEERMVARVEKRPLTDAKRIDYANLMRENGNRKYKEQKYEDAVEFYETAITHVTGSSFHDNPDLKPEARAIELKCHNNIAQSAVGLKNYTGALEHCRKALAINPKSAKAYYRMGVAYAARGCDKDAISAFNKALQHVSDDPSVSAAAIRKELEKSSGETTKQKTVMKSMYSGFLGGNTGFGVKKGFAALSGGALSPMQSLFNFRDITGGKAVEGRKCQKHVLYRSSAVPNLSATDLNALCHEYGVKTVIDLRTDYERQESMSKRNKRFYEEFSLLRVAEDPEKEGACATTLVSGVKGVTDLKKAMEGRVCVEVDVLDSLYDEMLTTQERLVNAGLRLICQTDRAAVHKLMCSQGRIELPDLLRKVLDERGPELVHVMELIADPANHPVVVSCAQGKDLTGLVSLLVLGCIGCEEDVLLDDFMTSLTDIPDEQRKALSAALARNGLPVGHAYTLPLDDAQELLDFLDGRYGGPNGYLQYHGFDDAKQAALKRVLLRD